MTHLEIWILGYLLNSLWQVPLVFAGAWCSARLVRRIGPRAEHKVWVIALLLEAALPACTFRVEEVVEQLRRLTWFGLRGTQGSEVIRVTLSAQAGPMRGLLQLPHALLVIIVAVYVGSLLYFAGRICWGLGQTRMMRRTAEQLDLPAEAPQRWARCRRVFAMERAEIGSSSMISGPVTIGTVRPMLLLPIDFLATPSGDDLEAVMAHECAHMTRHDFAKNVLYGVLSLPVAYHPLLWLTRTYVAGSREMVCDEMADEAIARKGLYARSLLRLASMLAYRTQASISHAIGIFDANIFERRLMNLTQKPEAARGVRRFAVAILSGVIAIATCGSALALRLSVATPQESTTNTPLKIDIDKIKSVYKKPPVYPAEAKAKNDILNGPVVLAVIIGKDGAVEQIKVSKSLRPDYDRSALDAVRDWRWEPYLLNGDPIEVKADVTINYSVQP